MALATMAAATTPSCFITLSICSSSLDSGARSTLESLTIPELKEKLREKGLKVSGKKGDLIARLLE